MVHIPSDLLPYVSFDEHDGLIHDDNMPNHLNQLFHDVRNELIEAEKQNIEELKNLIEDD